MLFFTTNNYRGTGRNQLVNFVWHLWKIRSLFCILITKELDLLCLHLTFQKLFSTATKWISEWGFILNFRPILQLIRLKLQPAISQFGVSFFLLTKKYKAKMRKRKFYRVYMTKKSCCYYLLSLHSCTCQNAHFALPSWVLPVFFLH